MENELELRTFLIEAKKECYASGKAGAAGPRPGAVDLTHSRGPWMYLDSYYGGKSFLGEEVVWHEGRAVWGMNYHGFMETEDIPETFSPFLKAALMEVRSEAPYRGPSHFSSGDFDFRCCWEGSLDAFFGEEHILLSDRRIYSLRFHGGAIV